jgi:hypothetical protein
MNTLFRSLALATSLTALGALAGAQVGEKLPAAEVQVVHPAAKTLDAFKGRTILIEFFAHW